MAAQDKLEGSEQQISEPTTVAEIEQWLRQDPQERVSECLAAWTPGDL